jgi:hypothetical protein
VAGKVHDELAQIARRYDTFCSSIIFSVTLYLFIIFVALVGFHLALRLSRRLLVSLAVTHDRLVIMSLIVFVVIVNVVIVTGCMFAIGIFGSPALWLLIPAAVFISLISLKLGFFALISVGGLTWLFSPAGLVMLALIIFSPLVATGFVTTAAMGAHSTPRIFYCSVHRVLKLCSEQNPVVVLTTIGLLMTGLLSGIVKCICWLF